VEISIRELEEELSRYLAEVRDGRTVTITDRGEPMARIVPIGSPSRLEQLRAEGRITRAGRTKTPSREPLEIEGTVSDLIDDQCR
jgi:prevent-host-death family protein